MSGIGIGRSKLPPILEGLVEGLVTLKNGEFEVNNQEPEKKLKEQEGQTGQPGHLGGPELRTWSW